MTHQPVNWDALAQQLQRHMTDMVHHDTDRRYGDEFYAEALRRTFGYSANDGSDGRRVLPYDTVNRTTGLTTVAEADWTRDSHTVVDRLARESAETQIKEMRAEVRRVYRESAADLAALIRGRCNERSVPSRLRREGVLLAADWIDPAVPKDAFGDPVRVSEAAPGGRIGGAR